jgi:hypothetical protein
VPGHANAHFVRNAADPREFCRIKERLLVAKQGLHEDAAVECCDFAAVALHHIVSAICRRQASSPRLVHDDDSWIARHVSSEETRHGATHNVVGAANAESDLENDRPGAIERRDLFVGFSAHR